MSCTQQPITAGPQIVYCNTNEAAFNHAFTAPIESSRFDKFRISLEVRNITTDMVLSRALRWSNDGITWDSWQTFGDTVSVDGPAPQVGYTDPSGIGSPKLYIQLGINALGTNDILEMAIVAMRIEFV